MFNFNDFLKDCNAKYGNEYLSVARNDFRKCLNSVKDTGSLIAGSFNCAVNNSNYISLKHLQAYHNWLLENYDIKPKPQKD